MSPHWERVWVHQVCETRGSSLLSCDFEWFCQWSTSDNVIEICTRVIIRNISTLRIYCLHFSLVERKYGLWMEYIILISNWITGVLVLLHKQHFLWWIYSWVPVSCINWDQKVTASRKWMPVTNHNVVSVPLSALKLFRFSTKYLPKYNTLQPSAAAALCVWS